MNGAWVWRNGKLALNRQHACCYHRGWIGDFCNVSKFYAYSVKRLLLTTAKLVWGLSDVATTNVCKVDTNNRNHIERSRWMKWLITGLRQKKYPLIWIHYKSPLFRRGYKKKTWTTAFFLVLLLVLFLLLLCLYCVLDMHCTVKVEIFAVH